MRGRKQGRCGRNKGKEERMVRKEGEEGWADTTTTQIKVPLHTQEGEISLLSLLNFSY
jgi:hypothetical protein